MLSKRDPRLYVLFKIRLSKVATLAIAHNTRRFLPENLGIEAWGVAGGYIELWKKPRRRARSGESWCDVQCACSGADFFPEAEPLFLVAGLSIAVDSQYYYRASIVTFTRGRSCCKQHPAALRRPAPPAR